MNRYSRKTALAFFMSVLLLAGCKDFWHPQDDGQSNGGQSDDPANKPSSTKTVKLSKNVYDGGSNNQGEVDGMFTQAVQKGAIYKLTVAGKSDRDIPSLQAVLIDHSAEAWTELSTYNAAGVRIAANQNFSTTIELSAIKNGGNINTARSNMVVIQGIGTNGDAPAFNGTITLTLTELKIVRK